MSSTQRTAATLIVQLTVPELEAIVEAATERGAARALDAQRRQAPDPETPYTTDD